MSNAAPALPSATASAGSVPALEYKAKIKVPPVITGTASLPTDKQVKAAVEAGLTAAGIAFTSVKVK